jgi:hypothetical protein
MRRAHASESPSSETDVKVEHPDSSSGGVEQTRSLPTSGSAVDSLGSMRRAPDIGDLARRGGLPNAISPYRLDDLDGQLFLQASGTSTATVNSYVILAFEKDVHDARAFSRQFRDRGVEPDLVRQRFRNLHWLSNTWIQREIIDLHNADDDSEIAKELFTRMVEEVPRLGKWPPLVLDDRPYLVRQGEIACRYLEELKQINRLCSRKRLSVETLRSQRPEFSFWSEMDSANDSRRKHFYERFEQRGGWKADVLYEVVAELMGSGSSETVKTWCKKYRRWSKRVPHQNS